MESKQLVERILASDLTNVTNIGYLFDMARNLDDVDLGKKARDASLRAARHSEKAYELSKEIYDWLATKDFDSYLIALEWNRKPEERFYMPRRKQLRSAVEGLQALADDRLDELFISMPPRCGKLLADSTPVLTTEGWKKHGDLKVGDYVFNPDGKAVRVIAVHPKHHTTHTVTMSDGSSFKCHFRHEWQVYDRGRQKTVCLETQEMIGKLEPGRKDHERGHRYRFQIPLRTPIDGVKKELPVKPYSFGAWLGDGSNQKPRINIAKEDFAIASAMMFEGYLGHMVYVHKQTDVLSLEFKDLKMDLQKIGMCHSRRRAEKYIPECYLTASYEDRLQLLAGLLDTDGTLSKKEHRYHFSTTEPRLRDTVVQLISTFGWRCCVTEYAPHTSSFGIVGKKVGWSIGFNPTIEIPCRLERKQLKEFSKQRRIAIASIEESEPEQGNCITVEGGMYLVGERMIPTHNTSLLMFYMTWAMGRDSERANLYCAYSDTITNAFYNGVLEILNDPATYRWHEIFPNSQIAATNSKDETINLDRKKRYASLTCRSLYGTLNGAVDANGILMSDDLLSGIEEALSKDRLITAWGKVDNNMLSRAKGNCKILWCGTRWSLADPIGLRIDTLTNNENFRNRRFKVINFPALDENDESNFDYDYGVGFSTDIYRQRRASFERNNDLASWNAQYMGEPIEREGTVFSPYDFRYFNGVLPDDQPERIFMACDPAWGGGDFVAAPVVEKFGNDLYVVDVVYDNSDKRVTQKLVVDAIERWNVSALQVEATKTTKAYADDIEAMLMEKGKKINLTTKAAPQTIGGKTQRIFDKAPDIRERMVFLEDGKRSKAYSLFMQNVFSFKMVGKNKNDDAPDSLCMAIDMDQMTTFKTRIIDRLW